MAFFVCSLFVRDACDRCMDRIFHRLPVKWKGDLEKDKWERTYYAAIEKLEELEDLNGRRLCCIYYTIGIIEHFWHCHPRHVTISIVLVAAVKFFVRFVSFFFSDNQYFYTSTYSLFLIRFLCISFQVVVFICHLHAATMFKAPHLLSIQYVYIHFHVDAFFSRWVCVCVEGACSSVSMPLYV